MPKRVQLQDFEVSYKKKQACVLITGDELYYGILCNAFPNRSSSLFPDVRQRFDWGVYIDCSENELDSINNLLKMFTYAVYIDDDLNQCFALDFYYKPYWTNPEGGQTYAGELVHKSKYYEPNDREQVKSLQSLVDYFYRFVELHPSYQRSDFIVPVPYFGDKPFDLPTAVVQQLCDRLNIQNGAHIVSKTHATKSMKSLESREDKQENIANAFSVSENVNLNGKIITVIDDVYRSGVTINELARVLTARGAIVLGLVAAKTIRD